MLRLHNILKSSRAAIDLASIMVGIIVIGLIGGVIAATVFAVIPWAQDRAAKQQLDSIASAQSAYRGLSTDKDNGLKDASTAPTDTSDPNQVVLNSTFTGSAGLAANNLLAENAAVYCVQATTDGSDYNAYAKSGSGKVFQSSAKGISASEVADISTTCLGDGSGASEPVPLSIAWDFDNPATVQNWAPYSLKSDSLAASAEVSNTTATAHSGTHSLKVVPTVGRSGANTAIQYGPDGSTWVFTKGKTYTVSMWVRQNTNLSPHIYVDSQLNSSESGVSSNSMSAVNTWTQLSVTFVAKSNQRRFGIQFEKPAASGNIYYIDDVLVQEVK